MTEFMDAQQLALDHPDTFQAPELSMLQVTVVPGDYVKVATNKERFWVKVVAVFDGLIKAKVSNELVNGEFYFGEPVVISHKNIYMLDHEVGDFADGEDDNIQPICNTCNKG